VVQDVNKVGEKFYAHEKSSTFILNSPLDFKVTISFQQKWCNIYSHTYNRWIVARLIGRCSLQCLSSHQSGNDC